MIHHQTTTCYCYLCDKHILLGEHDAPDGTPFVEYNLRHFSWIEIKHPRGTINICPKHTIKVLADNSETDLLEVKETLPFESY